MLSFCCYHLQEIGVVGIATNPQNGELYKEQGISVWKFQVICLYRHSEMELGKFI